MDLNKYLMGTRDADCPEDLSYPIAKRIVCADGFSLSVQANQGAYCAPRNNRGPWYEVEVGFPSAKPELIMDRAELHGGQEPA